MSEETFSRGERTREDIITAAHQLFMENGFHGTSMRQIAERARIAVGGIYNHFASKDDIFQAVLLEQHPFFDILPAMNAAQGKTLEEFVREAAKRMLGGLGERSDFLNLMFIELVEFKAVHVTQLFQLFYPQTLDFAQHFLQNSADLKPIPLPILIRAFIGLFFSYFMTELLIGKNLPPEMQQGTVDYFVDIFLRGVLAEGREME